MTGSQKTNGLIDELATGLNVLKNQVDWTEMHGHGYWEIRNTVKIIEKAMEKLRKELVPTSEMEA